MEMTIRRAMSPELVALILVLVIVAGGLVVVFSGSGGPSFPSGPAPSAAAVAATASPSVGAASTPPRATATLPDTAPPPTPAVTPKASASPSAPPWIASAQALIQADLRVIQWREALRSELESQPKTSDNLAHLLRSTNVAIDVATNWLDALEALDAPRDIVATLRTAHQGALDASARTLSVTVHDVAAYRTGGAAVVTALAPIDVSLEALAAAGGLPDPIVGPLPSLSSASPAP